MIHSDLARYEGGCLCCGKAAADCSCVQEALEENAERGHFYPHPIHGAGPVCDPEDLCEMCKQRLVNLRGEEER